MKANRGGGMRRGFEDTAFLTRDGVTVVTAPKGGRNVPYRYASEPSVTVTYPYRNEPYRCDRHRSVDGEGSRCVMGDRAAMVRDGRAPGAHAPAPRGGRNSSPSAMGAALWKNDHPQRVSGCAGAWSGKSGYAGGLTGPSWGLRPYAVLHRAARALRMFVSADGFFDVLGRTPPQNRHLPVGSSPISGACLHGFGPGDATTEAFNAGPEISGFQELDKAVRAFASASWQTTRHPSALTVSPRPGGRR